MDVREVIQQFHGGIERDPHHRYRSWEHCYGFFRSRKPTEIAVQRDIRDMAALQLGFYLASWGMYRGSTFLLQQAYTVHLGVIDCLTSPALRPLWDPETDYGWGDDDSRLDRIIVSAIQAVREAYKPFGEATDTLVTKVILGTLGCLPACDQYFIKGYRSQGHGYSCVNASFIAGIRCFRRHNINALREEQRRIKDSTGVHYPLMKLIDMYFWQIGSSMAADDAEAGNGNPNSPKANVDLSAAIGGIQSGTSGTGARRIYWHGHSGFSIARWCGAKGWSVEQAIKVFDRLNIPLGKSAIVGGVYAGRAGKRGEPARLTGDQVAQMEEHRN